MKISITNHTGSRNRGCEALVRSTIAGIKENAPKNRSEIEFFLHSNDPHYDGAVFDSINIVFSYALKTPNHLPYAFVNKLGYKFLGFVEILLRALFSWLPFQVDHFTVLKQSDLIIATGGDVFTSDYGNLRKHMAPVIASNTPVYICSHTIGPFESHDEKYFCENIENVVGISVREQESYDYLNNLNLDIDLVLAADVAFNLEPRKLISWWNNNFEENDSVVALSISEGIIRYSNLDRRTYLNTWINFIEYLIEKNKKVLLVPHVMESNPGNNDLMIINEVIQGCSPKIKESICIASETHTACELKGIIGCCEALIGTRTHATIASLSQGLPTVSIAYSRKAYGIMRDVFGDEIGGALTIKAQEMTLESLVKAYDLSVSNPPDTEVISNLKSLSQENFKMVEGVIREKVFLKNTYR
jgi:colanic acid/amylovoran biosynthesis protein